MNQKIPQVREFMSTIPHTIESNISIKLAQEKMRKFQIRHLPVSHGGRIVGILSDRNIKEAINIPAYETLQVRDVMMPEPYHVTPDTALNEVAAAMAEEKFGCAVVEDGQGNLVGIFTTTDACRALRQILDTVFLG